MMLSLRRETVEREIICSSYTSKTVCVCVCVCEGAKIKIDVKIISHEGKPAAEGETEIIFI